MEQPSVWPYYAVWRGRVPGVYTTLRDYQQQVEGFPGSIHQGFGNLRDAIVWMRGEVKGGNTSVAVATGGLLSWLHGIVADAGFGSSSDAQSGNPHVSADFPLFMGRYVGLDAGEDAVPDTQRGGFIITEEMEVYLVRACTRLRVGTPEFTHREFFSVNGHHQVGYFTSVHCSEKDIHLEVASGLFWDDAFAREDAAYNLLSKLLVRTGRSIRDYNYREVTALRERIRGYERELATPLAQRLREVEMERDELKSVVDKIGKWLDD
ncbi:hypothetical protein PIB30_001696 [Stylosanthes scabra]|uniref:Ribonuclease H1 N-terminal domain-containing protein n=1 Tax=Stylosanthes scabra TaxID=79078 RepID=A0ABU6U299_9FABA|nr:hypothetical protein [Stylosanthes scabra]